MITVVGATGHVGGKIADILINKGEPGASSHGRLTGSSNWRAIAQWHLQAMPKA